MDLKRFFSDEINEKTAVLSGEEFAHAVKVTRHKVGYKLIISDYNDTDYYCTVSNIQNDKLIATIYNIEKNQAELKQKLVLCIGVCKEIDMVVQKAVELGVTEIVPFFSSHSNFSNCDTARLSRIIKESSKQCGRSRLAKISTERNFNEILSGYSGFPNKILFYEYEKEKTVADCKLVGGDTVIFIGSEGGFSEDEIRAARAMNYNVLSLGKRILRVATATVSALTLVLNGLGEL